MNLVWGLADDKTIFLAFFLSGRNRKSVEATSPAGTTGTNSGDLVRRPFELRQIKVSCLFSRHSRVFPVNLKTNNQTSFCNIRVRFSFSKCQLKTVRSVRPVDTRVIALFLNRLTHVIVFNSFSVVG